LVRIRPERPDAKGDRVAKKETARTKAQPARESEPSVDAAARQRARDRAGDDGSPRGAGAARRPSKKDA
jgi:hypothetical protein